METVTTTPQDQTLSQSVLPRSRELNREDLDRMPDDGHRYELIDGALIVTPAPSPGHQTGLAALLVLLTTSCPDHLRVLPAPLDIALDEHSVLEPDLLVARKDRFTNRDLPEPPLLAVEVLSPSTRLIDLNLKKARYETAGCPSYWIVDPVDESIRTFQLDEDRYVESGRAAGQELLEVTRPFPVAIRPAELFR